MNIVSLKMKIENFIALQSKIIKKKKKNENEKMKNEKENAKKKC